MLADKPLYTAKHRATFAQTMNLVIAVLFAGLGLAGQNALLVLIGVVVALIVLYTRHAGYDIYPDRLVLRYVLPRRKVIPLKSIEDARVYGMTFGGQAVALRQKGAMGMLLRPADPEAFVSQLNAARAKAT